LGNPYRTILRREYPEPLIALLAFVLGIWLWDHYFGKSEGYAPGTEQVALLKIDRDLRLADAMEADPPWLKRFLGVGQPAVTQRESLGVLQKLANEKSISQYGLEAFAIIKSVNTGVSLPDIFDNSLPEDKNSEFKERLKNFKNQKGSWWHIKMLELWTNNDLAKSDLLRSAERDGAALRIRAMVARSSVLLLGITGLFFVPVTLRFLKKGFSRKLGGYGGAWTLPLGLVFFFVATLAWIGFTMTLELGMDCLSDPHPLVGILLDSAARILPPLIALGLLFKRPTHAIRVMGLNQPIYTRAILGMFSLLMISDQILRWSFGSASGHDPGGGLSLGDSGLWGLVFALVSACLLAPLAEEILYRGVLFRSLWNRIGVLPAAVLSAAVFAVLHFYGGYGLLSVGIFGFACALLYAGTGSLTTVIALHGLYNFSIKIPEWIVYHSPLG
jgi:membrane protease YdiL (CAAX protease family)